MVRKAANRGFDWTGIQVPLALTEDLIGFTTFRKILNGHHPAWLSSGDVHTPLKRCVDEWLDTAVTQDGTEDARQRQLAKAPSACAAIQRFSKNQLPGIEVTPESQISVRLHETLAGFDGLPQDVADKLCTLFFLCDWQVRLAKCRRTECGRYFELKQWNRVYTKGTVCSKDCTRIRSQQSALEATKRRRDQEHADRLARAAEAIAEWVARKRCTRTTWQEYVRKQHPDITAKSLTRWINSSELESPTAVESASIKINAKRKK
jgi:hypothetical protein